MKLEKFFFLFYKLLQPPSKLMLMLSETTSNSWPPICIFIVHLMLVNCIFIVHNTLVYCRRNSNKNTRKTISSRKSLRKYLLCKIYFLTTFTALIKDKKPYSMLTHICLESNLGHFEIPEDLNTFLGSS